MRTKRGWLFESLEPRIALDASGNAYGPAMQSYIVALNDNVTNPAATVQQLLHGSAGKLGHVYSSAVKGFSVELPDTAASALAQSPFVKRVELDFEMRAFAQTTPTGIQRIAADQNSVAKIDGLDERVDIDVAVIDSGIAAHPDLNIAGGANFAGGPSYSDGYGHGTHVAGTIGALDNGFGVVGVAPGARLWSVRVLGNTGTGRLSNIIAGVDWVTANANMIEVANMSLGGQGASQTYREAIQASVGAGVVYVVASGNEYRDILGSDLAFGTRDDTVPAAYPEVATISAYADTDGEIGGFGAITSFSDSRHYEDDEYADFANYSNSNTSGQSFYDNNNVVSSPGLGIDLVMPGVDILSTHLNGGYALGSGTSMAAPHAAGLAALYIASHGRATSAAGVYAIRQALIDQGKDWTGPEGMAIAGTARPTLGDSPDKHLERLGWADFSPAEPNEAPMAVAALSPTGIEDVALTFDGSASSDPENDALTFHWDFGDGQTLATSSPVANHIYAYGGVFNVTLTVNDGHGNQDSDAVSTTIAEVNDMPVANAGGTYTGYQNQLVVFDASASTDFDNQDGTNANNQILTYHWDFGDGVTLSTTNSSSEHVYGAVGSYQVSLVVDDGLAQSLPSLATAEITAEPVSDPNELYVWDIGFDSKSRGPNTDYRVMVEVHNDSNGDGNPSADDSRAANVQVEVELRSLAGALVQTLTGTTNSQGIFQSGWIRGLSSGQYRAEVVGMVHATFVWNHLIISPLDDDFDNDDLPDDVFTVA
ncbi:MAG: S8 family serine peptidase [Planctomycetales bacterium]|nr:S8 family serine peptidase [Planctomycetales bacterium]